MKNIWLLSVLTAFTMMGCMEDTKKVEDTKQVNKEVKEKTKDGKK